MVQSPRARGERGSKVIYDEDVAGISFERRLAMVAPLPNKPSAPHTGTAGKDWAPRWSMQILEGSRAGGSRPHPDAGSRVPLTSGTETRYLDKSRRGMPTLIDQCPSHDREANRVGGEDTRALCPLHSVSLTVPTARLILLAATLFPIPRSSKSCCHPGQAVGKAMTWLRLCRCRVGRRCRAQKKNGGRSILPNQIRRPVGPAMAWWVCA
jgi:hypothetical protein